MTPVLAHSWGWDEILYFGIPIAAAFVWIRWIERRARAAREQDETDHDTDG
ncbi:MAG: hypothetical protein KQH83_10715 [Actinobacteria bacterium]|nr:hypothetical protein [Actinomycetota bacterium]